MLLAGNLLATASGDVVLLDFACYLQGTCWLLLRDTESTVCREPAGYYFRRLSLSRLCMLLAGNLLATTSGDLVYLDFGMMSEAPQGARYAIIAHVVHLVNRDYQAMCRDYYKLEFMDPSVATSPIAPALAEFFDDALGASVSQLNFRAIVDGLGNVLFQYPFR